MPTTHSIAKIIEQNAPGQISAYFTAHREPLKNKEIPKLITLAIKHNNFLAIAEIARRHRFKPGSDFEQALFYAVLALAQAPGNQHDHALEAVNALLLAGTPTTYCTQDDQQHRPITTKVPRPYSLGDTVINATINIKYGSVYDLLVTMQDSSKAWVPFLKFANRNDFKYQNNHRAKITIPHEANGMITAIAVDLNGNTLLREAEEIVVAIKNNVLKLGLSEMQRNNNNQNFCSLIIARQGGRPPDNKTIPGINDQTFNRSIVLQAQDQYDQQKNIFKEILGYFAQTYRPRHNDYETRFKHFADILAQMKLYPQEMPGWIDTEGLKPFKKTSYIFFSGSQKYLDLIEQLKTIKTPELEKQYQEFAKDQQDYLKEGSYFQLAEKIDGKVHDYEKSPMSETMKAYGQLHG